MKHGVPLVPLAVVAALVLVPSGHASHLSMDMPGLGGAAVLPASPWLLATIALAALVQGLWLHASERLPPRARWTCDAAWLLALAPLAVSAAGTRGLAGTWGLSVGPAGGELRDRIAEVGSASGEHMWALLGALALGVGFGAARTLKLGLETRANETAGFAGAFVTFALTWPLVALILATSTGLDWISSWIRWGGCGLAMVVCAASALVPARGEARVIGGTTFVLAVMFSLLAEREYVEALGHDALAHRDPFDPTVEWARGLAEIAAAVEPRERYGLLVALLPWIALAPGVSWRAAAPQLAAGVLVVLVGVAAAASISSRLDHGALAGAGAIVFSEQDEPAELRWSTRALPRTVPWLRAIRGRSAPREPVSPVHCAAWMAPATPGG